MKPSISLRKACAAHCKAGASRVRRALAALAVSTLALASGQAFAADCDLRTSNADVKYGPQYRGELMADARAKSAPLGKRQLTITAMCRQSTSFTLRLDGQPAAAGGYRFGTRGNFTARIGSATVDGAAVQLATRDSAGALVAAPTVSMAPNIGVTAAMAGGQSKTGKTFSATVEIETYVDEADTRPRERTSLEGLGAFTLETR